MKRLELVYCEMEPGTGLFFHSNLLHASAANLSDKSRWSIICCYNAARNDPYKDSHHPRYTPLQKVADDAILKAGNAAGQRRFLDPKDDRTSEGVPVTDSQSVS
jgi:ectoine hydroxylase-related dioxygenase (phytanoyl-CoA dioxygenase family)